MKSTATRSQYDIICQFGLSGVYIVSIKYIDLTKSQHLFLRFIWCESKCKEQSNANDTSKEASLQRKMVTKHIN